MAFIDEVKIFVKAGNGGNGVIRWLHLRGKEFGGPSGGDGGAGGNVFARALRNAHLLSLYRTKKDYFAKKGEDGKKDSLHGADGENLELLLPVGSIITNLDTGKKIYLSKEGETALLLQGGKGGRGNEFFKSSINTTPKKCTLGTIGKEANFFIEVELIADIGLIGLPNAGKTSLLNEFTRAHAKTGDYPFTTLEPNLGECFGYIISDIPGLIEGASEGRGLGYKFLRHIRRVKILVHLISLENEEPIKTYNIVRSEIEKYDSELLKKKEIVVLTKTDLIEDKAELKKIIAKMKKRFKTVKDVSLYDNKSIKTLQEFVLKQVK